MKVPSGNGDSVVGMRRALSIGGTAVIAAAVGAACSFAFSGAIALNDQAAVQVSASPVIVPAAEPAAAVFGAPQPVDATAPVVVPAPEPRDLVRSVHPRTSPSDPGQARAADAAAPAGTGAGTDQNGADGSLDLEETGDAATAAPGRTGTAAAGSEEGAAHSNRDAALAAAPGQSDPKRTGTDRSGLHSNRDAAPGHADSSSDPDSPDCRGG